jgi:hypothetical protein
MNRLSYIKSLLGFSVGAVVAKNVNPKKQVKQVKPIKKDYNVIFIGGPYDGKKKIINHSFYSIYYVPVLNQKEGAILGDKLTYVPTHTYTRAEYHLLRIKNNIATYIYSGK